MMCERALAGPCQRYTPLHPEFPDAETDLYAHYIMRRMARATIRRMTTSLPTTMAG
jgi:hypothetical protein